MVYVLERVLYVHPSAALDGLVRSPFGLTSGLVSPLFNVARKVFYAFPALGVELEGISGGLAGVTLVAVEVHGRVDLGRQCRREGRLDAWCKGCPRDERYHGEEV